MRRAIGRVGGKPRVLRDIVKAFRRLHRFARCRFACPTGTAVSQGFRTAHGFETGRMACDVPHRYATRSWPKALGNRLYGSLSTLLGMSSRPRPGGQKWRVGPSALARGARPLGTQRCFSTLGQTERSTFPPRRFDRRSPLARPSRERDRSLSLLPVTGREVSCRVLSGTKGALATIDGAPPEEPNRAGTSGFVTCIEII